jgi:hypothetical protein
MDGPSRFDHNFDHNRGEDGDCNLLPAAFAPPPKAAALAGCEQLVELIRGVAL